jgi:hypothetical protein
MAKRGKKIAELFEIAPEPPKPEPPKMVKIDRKDLEQAVTDLEFALVARDRYAKLQQDRINSLEEELKSYHRFLHAIELNFNKLKDYRAVQELVDRACQWSWADRARKGEFKNIDRAAQLEMATKRLGDFS